MCNTFSDQPAILGKRKRYAFLWITRLTQQMSNTCTTYSQWNMCATQIQHAILRWKKCNATSTDRTQQLFRMGAVWFSLWDRWDKTISRLLSIERFAPSFAIVLLYR